MSIQPDRVTTLETIEHLDFQPEIPCEHSQHATTQWHGGPATQLVRVFPHCVGRPTLLALCEPVWLYSGAHGLFCTTCGQRNLNRDDIWLLVERIGGTS